MSVRRQQAYQTGLMVPGPNLDPEGWFPLPNATIRGFFNEILGAVGKREIAVNYVVGKYLKSFERNHIIDAP